MKKLLLIIIVGAVYFGAKNQRYIFLACYLITLAIILYIIKHAPTGPTIDSWGNELPKF